MRRRMLTKVCALAAALLVMACESAPEVPEPKTPTPKLTAEPPPEPVEHAGGIIAESSPAGLKVLVDGKPVGKTPVTVENVAPGTHEVKFLDEENGDVTLMVDVSEGQYPLVKHNVIPKAGDARYPDGAKKKQEK